MRFVCFLLVALFAVSARAQECPAYIEPDIIVTPSIGEPIINNAYSANELEELQYSTDSYQQERVPSGLTTFTQTIQSAYEFREAFMEDGSVCAQVSTIALTMTIVDLTVHIASELPKGTCSYDTILDHEMKHVRMAKRFLNGAIEPARRQLKALLDGIGVIHAASREDARSYIKKTVGNFVETLSRNLIVVCNTMEQEIDTEEEYERLSKACHGEMGAFARHVRRK